MKEEQIQTLHPFPGKTNKRISLKKYKIIREQLLLILAEHPLTHTELMEALYNNVKNCFEGGVQWYGETVKLDLEARGLVKRLPGKVVKYALSSNITDAIK